jgi:hypothetical protein
MSKSDRGIGEREKTVTELQVFKRLKRINRVKI